MTTFIFLFGFFIFSFNAHAADDVSQQILDLRKQIADLTKQANQYKGTIAEKQKLAITLKHQVDILNNQILNLQVSIAITQRNISLNKIQISDSEAKIFDTQQDIQKKKQAIGELISSLYQRDKLSLLAILMKSDQLSDFTTQAEQDQSLNQKLVELTGELNAQKDNLETQKNQLDQQKAGLETLNQKQTSQKSALDNTLSSKDKLLTDTKGQEAKFQAMLDDTELQQSKFFEDLKSLEGQAVKNGAYIVHVTASSVPPKGTKIFDWPFESYYLTQGYGMTSYALKGAYGGQPHSGIDIVSSSGPSIHPIGHGYVLASGTNNGWGNWIAIRHDNNMVSLYGHMVSPAGLSNNTEVTADSVLGYEGKTGNVTGEHLHLSLYKDFFTYISPASGQLYFNYFDGTVNPLDYL